MSASYLLLKIRVLLLTELDVPLSMERPSFDGLEALLVLGAPETMVLQRALLRASEGEAHRCAFQRRKDARSRHQRLFEDNVRKTKSKVCEY